MTSPPRCLYGPLPSRRLGLSLGLDLIPFKSCTYDCVYCQLGATTDLTLARREYVDSDALLAEVEAWLESGGEADCLTLAGSGEPTLHSGLGALIPALRRLTSLPLALLTNGSLLSEPSVRAAFASVDLLLPSLDAATPEAFARLNRPHPDLRLEAVVAGLRDLRREATGEMWLEIMLVPGYNDSPAELAALAEAVQSIDPHRVHLNTPVRPAPAGHVKPLPRAALEKAREFLGPRAEIIASPPPSALSATPVLETEALLRLLRRRPCTVADLAAASGLSPPEVLKHLDLLLRAGQVDSTSQGRSLFYRARG